MTTLLNGLQDDDKTYGLEIDVRRRRPGHGHDRRAALVGHTAPTLPPVGGADATTPARRPRPRPRPSPRPGRFARSRPTPAPPGQSTALT